MCSIRKAIFDIRLKELQEKNEESKILRKYITEEFPKHSKFHQYMDELNTNNDLIIKGNQIFIQKYMRKTILTKIMKGTSK